MMEEIIVECSIQDIEKIRNLPGFEDCYMYPLEEIYSMHPYEYGRLKMEDTLLRFRVYSEDLKSRVLDSYGNICLHLGRIRSQILNGGDCMDNITDLRDYIQMCIQTYV